LVERLMLDVAPEEIGDDQELTSAYDLDSVRLFELVIGTEEAVKVLESIIEIVPGDIQAKVRMAELYEMLGDELKLNTYISDAARMAIAENEKDRAYEMFRVILNRSPRLDNVRRSFFNISLDQGDKEIAAAEGVTLGRHCAERYDFDNAMVIIGYVLKFLPTWSMAHIERDKIHFENGEIEKGLEGLQETIGTLKTEGNFFLLKRHLRDIKKYVPKNSGIHETLGAVYAKEGAFEAALDEFRIAQTLFADSDNAAGAEKFQKIINKLIEKIEGTIAEEAPQTATHAGLTDTFKKIDTETESETSVETISTLIKENSLKEIELLQIEENCRERGLDDLAAETQRQLVRLYIARGVYTKAREVFESAGKIFEGDIEILQLIADSAERSGDNRFAIGCLNALFKQFDSLGNSELATGICARILSIEPMNKRAIGYVRQFADSKDRLTTEPENQPALRSSTSYVEEPAKQSESRELSEKCQAQIQNSGLEGDLFDAIQQQFFSGLTEESLGNYDESIRIFTELLADLPE